MSASIRLSEHIHAMRDTFGFHEDFLEFVSGDLFTDTSGDSGASWATTDAKNGILTGVTGATDNNEAALLTTKEIFKLTANKPLYGECKLQFTEANTDDANVMFAFMNAIGADAMVDAGAGPKTSFSGAAIYKVDGGTKWKVMVSDGATQNSAELTAANSLDGLAKTAGGAAYQTLRIEFQMKSSTLMNVFFYVDDVHVYTMTDQTYANATEMNCGVVVKAGDTNSETLLVDYIRAYQVR